MSRGGLYRCAVQACGATFLHPIPFGGDCPTDERGRCAHLTRAGWRPVTLRVELDKPGAHRVHILTQGGWICPACVTHYVPARQRSLW